MWMMSRTGSMRGGFGGDLKRVSLLSLAVGRRRVTFVSSQWPRGGCHTCCGGRWKSQHRKIVPLSLCRKTFKLKGNKKFRTWTKKSWVFFVFRDSCVLCICALWTFYVRFTSSCMGMLQFKISCSSVFISYQWAIVTSTWLVDFIVGFYGISTLVGCVMPNHVYIYIRYLWFVNK